MGAFTSTGTRITKGAFPATAAPVDPATVQMVLTANVYTDFAYDTENQARNAGQKRSGRTVWRKSGAVVTQAEIDALFEPASIDTVTPASGPAAGGTVVTVTGQGLSGVTAATVGGTAATAVTVVDGTKVRFTTAARAAGAGLTVSLTDDSGTITKTAAYSYT